ncbi:MAG: NUDIX domain-containing protein [Clostridia bacterium]|nr:NUDIX domain-containing protein [Clostridia bacterium]
MEQWDLYDKDRIKAGIVITRGDSFPNDLYRTVVHIALINSEDRMLIQQRQKDKHGWPDLWDISVGGHVISGETSSQGAQRELYEELGIDMDFSSLRPSLTVNFNSGFDDIYIIRKDIELSDIRLQKEEMQSVKWAELDEILSMIDSGRFIPYHKSLIRLIFDMKDHAGAHSITKN